MNTAKSLAEARELAQKIEQQKHQFPRLLTSNDGRHWYGYADNPERVYPSVSAVLAATEPEERKQSLQKWKDTEPAADYITRTAAKIGTQTHEMISQYVQHRLGQREYEPFYEDFDLLPAAHFREILPQIENMVYVATELPLASRRWEIAGTVDLIALNNGVLTVLDFKTKRKKQRKEWMTRYFVQGAAYAEMFEEIMKYKIEDITIIVSSEDNRVGCFSAPKRDYVAMWYDRLQQYKKSMEAILTSSS